MQSPARPGKVAASPRKPQGTRAQAQARAATASPTPDSPYGISVRPRVPSRAAELAARPLAERLAESRGWIAGHRGASASASASASAPAAAAAAPATPSATATNADKPAPEPWPVSQWTQEKAANPRLNVIGPSPSRWQTGVPPVMGAHLMPSGDVAPLSMSTGEGTGVPHMFKYPPVGQEGTKTEVLMYPNSASAGAALAKRLAAASKKAIADRGHFSVALSGGSLLDLLRYSFQVADRPDFSKWHVFYADERVVPHASPDSTHGVAKARFLTEAGVPEDQQHCIREGADAATAARAYEGSMLNLPESVLPRGPNGVPALDVCLLGVGPDGHVASLFPNRPAVAAKAGGPWVVPVVDSPKPPAERITLTLPCINASREVMIVACGAGKAEVVARALETQALPGALPVQLVKPVGDGTLTWILDLAAAGEVNPELWDNPKRWPRSEVPDSV